MYSWPLMLMVDGLEPRLHHIRGGNGGRHFIICFVSIFVDSMIVEFMREIQNYAHDPVCSLFIPAFDDTCYSTRLVYAL